MSLDTLILNETQLQTAADILKRGGIVAFPTETVYGLGANALDGNAVKKIFAAKGRPCDNPLIVHIADYAALNELVTDIPSDAKKLMDKFWPGPLTIIMNKTDKIPSEVSGGLSTVAVRMPSQKTARELIRLCGLPLAAPSANTSGRPSPTSSAHVAEDLNGKIDAIIDGGSCTVGLESTVIDLTGTVPALLRPGGVTYEQLCAVLGAVEKKFECIGNEKPRSPGMKYKHYSPSVPVYVVRCDFAAYALQCGKNYNKIGIIARGNYALGEKFIVKKIGASPESYAELLFSALRELDSEGVDIILAEDVDECGINLAVRNRLYRAAAYKIIENME